jgi:hypothetical protein
MIPLLIPALGSAGVVLAANLAPDELTPTPERSKVNVPIATVTPEQWVSFVRLFVGPNTVTKQYRYGVFGMTVRRLVDLGVMRNLRAIHQKGGPQRGEPSIVWSAEWAPQDPPVSLKAFIGQPMWQYSLFAESMSRYATTPAVRDCVGVTVDDTTATLSGVLAVSHRAGAKGLKSWLKKEKERADFAHTSDCYRRANGLF